MGGTGGKYICPGSSDFPAKSKAQESGAVKQQYAQISALLSSWWHIGFITMQKYKGEGRSSNAVSEKQCVNNKECDCCKALRI